MEEVKYGKLVNFVHMLIKMSYNGQENLNLVDATCGNGFDTLFLCKVAGETGKVKAFDIQEEAIERTNTLLKSNLNYANYEVINDSHEYINKYMKNVDAAVFNLGYLPFSDKNITTKGETTLRAIENLIPLMNENGRIYIATYISHDAGEEIKYILDYLRILDKTKYNVLNINLVNKENTPPQLFIIEKNAW